MADVARAVERHGFLQLRRQRVQFVAHPRLQRLVVGMLRGVGGDGRRILGMEVAPPVHVVAQEFGHQLLEQGVVLAVRAKEAGIEGAPPQGRVLHGGGRAHAAASHASGWCARAMP